jgi:hypothetical protein
MNIKSEDSEGYKVDNQLAKATAAIRMALAATSDHDVVDALLEASTALGRAIEINFVQAEKKESAIRRACKAGVIAVDEAERLLKDKKE